ncbi:MAG: hypothetical protein ABJB21_05325 [bacterium]
MKIPPTALVHVLVGKSIAEALLVGALAVFAYLSVLPPHFHGWGELTEGGIAGWAVNNARPWERVGVQFFLDGTFSAIGVANETRPDVVSAGWAKDEWHGYFFPLRSLNVGDHEARVYALHDVGDGKRKTLQLLGESIRFNVDSQGKLKRIELLK